MKKQRLDALVVERGLAPSLEKARALVMAGEVVVDDQRVDKPGAPVRPDAEVRLKREALRYVSRGGLKLAAALEGLRLDVRGLVAADLGASTGGFTDCLLQAGAARVHAIDVGYGQLHERLRQDARVIAHERVNARTLTEADLPELAQVLVADVSFTSLRAVLPGVWGRLAPGALLVLLVKPQFELDAARVGPGGVVTVDVDRRAAVELVADFLRERGCVLLGDVESPVPGPAGNREILLAARTAR